MIDLKQPARIAMLAALRDKLLGGKIILMDDKDTLLVEMDIKDIDPVIDDFLHIREMQNYGQVYGKAKKAVLSIDGEELLEGDVTTKGKGGFVQLEKSTEIVEDALVKIKEAILSFAG